MRGLMRMLMMFGPMLFRMFQKYQRKQSKQHHTQNPANQVDKKHQVNHPQNKDSSEQA